MSFEPMTLGLYASFLGAFFGWIMALLSIFLILLILVQRGRGGGLTGALGGPGGQSAFGSKAGDLFTRITFIVAGIWILFCALAMFTLGDARNAFLGQSPTPSVSGTGEESDEGTSTSESDMSTEGGLDLPGLGNLDALNEELLGGSDTSNAEGSGSEASTTEDPASSSETGDAASTEAGTPPVENEDDAAAAGSESTESTSSNEDGSN